jgi:hypothetical protein
MHPPIFSAPDIRSDSMFCADPPARATKRREAQLTFCAAGTAHRSLTRPNKAHAPPLFYYERNFEKA